MLCCLVKKGHVWDWDSEQQEAFEKAKLLMKQVKALGISQAWLPFELDVPVTPEGMGWTLWQRQQETVSPGFWCQLWKGAEAYYKLPERSNSSLAVYTAFLQGEPLGKEQHIMART